MAILLYVWCMQMLRKGYTTGACAAGAAKAAALLLHGEHAENVSIPLPDGKRLTMPVSVHIMRNGTAECAVVKDSGDDPDVTNGIAVHAEVTEIPHGIEILGGEGIGRVTKPGLDQPVGAWAINSVPRKMIAAALAEVKGNFRVVISVPGGKELAKRTYNPHLGILGGISIIGTTGIVEPMSTSALIATIRTEMKMRRAEGKKILLLTPGNYGHTYLHDVMKLPTDCDVQCSNFIGEALDMAEEMGFSGIVLVGHAGKLIKLGAGIMNTHSHVADGRMETLVTCGVLAGVNGNILRKLTECITTDAAFAILEEEDCLKKVMDVAVQRIDMHLKKRVHVPVGAVLFSTKMVKSWQTADVGMLLRKIRTENGGSV